MKRAGVEEERWSKIEAEKKVEDSKWDMKHQQGINGKKNNSRYTSRGEHTTQDTLPPLPFTSLTPYHPRPVLSQRALRCNDDVC